MTSIRIHSVDPNDVRNQHTGSKIGETSRGRGILDYESMQSVFHIPYMVTFTMITLHNDNVTVTMSSLLILKSIYPDIVHKIICVTLT